MLGCEEDAKRTMTEAANIAHETGYVRVLQDLSSGPASLSHLVKKCGRLPSKSGSDVQSDSALILTEQEHRVLVLLATEHTYQQIAEELVVSINTVRTHVRHIYKKLGVNRRDQAVAEAKQLGLFAAVEYG